MMTAWGDALLRGNEFLLHTFQTGWRLDRAAFGAMLRRAAGRPAETLAATVTRLVVEGSSAWAYLSDGAQVETRFLIDATGRPGALSRIIGRRIVRLDSLMGFVLNVGSLTDGTEGLVSESFADGWWYTVLVPRSGRLVGCMTDSDLARRLNLSTVDGFLAALAKTNYVRRIADLCSSRGVPQIRPASSRTFAGRDWPCLLSVGDAALSVDPLSGQGIVRALRSGIFAAYAVSDWLNRGDERGLSRYRSLARRELAAYRATLGDYYAREKRWRDQPFWRRRHPTALSGIFHESRRKTEEY
jgi:flavin-dependent dehydrogenase